MISSKSQLLKNTLPSINQLIKQSIKENQEL